ncbi:MAG: hypothetical protein R3F43_03215 [bacterium]
MAGGGKGKNGRTIAILAVLVLLVVGFVVPINGQTGWQRLQPMLGLTPEPAAPASRAPKLARPAGQTESEISTVVGRPRVDDRSRVAEPLDDLTPKDRDALDRLIEKTKKP